MLLAGKQPMQDATKSKVIQHKLRTFQSFARICLASDKKGFGSCEVQSVFCEESNQEALKCVECLYWHHGCPQVFSAVRSFAGAFVQSLRHRLHCASLAA